MKQGFMLYLDVPLVQTDDDGGPEIRLRLERAENNLDKYGYQANLYEDGRMFLSAGLLHIEVMLFWAYLHHVSAGAITLPDSYAPLADLGLHKTQLNTRLYDAKGGTDFGFRAWCDGGSAFLGWGWRTEGGPEAPIGAARLDEAGLAGLLRMAQDMTETEL